jgi:hypothetical protein
MRQRHAIEMALDLARMPALARSRAEVPISANIIEVMRIAAAVPQACQDAAKATGEPVPLLIEAARFYLQQLLFRPDADSHRILGLQPGASRATARNHMRVLLQWLHPDRNHNLDAVYAERVLKAWREISELRREQTAQHPQATPRTTKGVSSAFRIPWILQPGGPQTLSLRTIPVWILPAGAIILLTLGCIIYYLGPEQTAAMISVH